MSSIFPVICSHSKISSGFILEQEFAKDISWSELGKSDHFIMLNLYYKFSAHSCVQKSADQYCFKNRLFYPKMKELKQNLLPLYLQTNPSNIEDLRLYVEEKDENGENALLNIEFDTKILLQHQQLKNIMEYKIPSLNPQVFTIEDPLHKILIATLSVTAHVNHISSSTLFKALIILLLARLL
jgi:hypothetical protein